MTQILSVFVGGDVVPESGDVLIDGTSVVRHPRIARLSLGVCPQFTAIDSQLTVREHLLVYGRLKGLKKGSELEENVEFVLRGAALDKYPDRLANKLSGGNKRKLSLAIALIGTPHHEDCPSSGSLAFIRQPFCRTHRRVFYRN
jgi:ATP-binding cassette subfamily A (ABC1) protein 3